MIFKLGDICDIYDGPHATPPETSCGPIFLGIKNINEQCMLDFTDIKHLSEDDYVQWTKRVTPQEDDIVFSYEATLNRYALIPKGFYGCLGRRLAIARVKDRNVVNPHFLYHYFCSPGWNSFILANKVIGSTVLRVSVEDFPDYEVDLPDISVQNAIVQVLDDVLYKRNNNNAICADLEAIAKLLYDYWFVQFDFPDENGKPYKSSGGKMVWNEDLKREIPERWEVKLLGDVFSFVKGRIPDCLSDISDEDYTSPYITIDVANNGLPQYCNPKSMVACNGEVIMVMDGAASGDVYLGNIGSLGSTFSMLPSKRDDISDALIYMLLKANMAIYKRANTGSTVPHANRSFIEKMKVCLPANASYMSNAFNLLFSKMILAREENQQLASLRDFLLPMLMNGQVKVGGKGDLPPVVYPTDEGRDEYMVAAEPKAEFKQNAGK